jgi:hypothetical protein
MIKNLFFTLLPPVGYFFLDKKVAKKSRPVRNLSEQSQKFRKNINSPRHRVAQTVCFSDRNFFTFSVRQISEWPLLKIDPFFVGILL